MRYQEFAPDPRLRAYIKCFWTLQGTDPAPMPERVLPDGRCELVLHCGDVFERVEENATRTQPRDLFVGPSTRSIVIKSGTDIDLVAVRFHPGGAALLLAAPLSELRDQAPGCSDLGMRFGLDLFDALHERTALERIALIEKILLQRLGHSRADAQMLRLQRLIERARGNLRIENLARHSGLSLRQLQRRFRDAIGVSPKAMSRLARLQSVLTFAREPGTTLGRVAARAGYSDQSHFTREFRELAGVSPRVYFEGTNQLNEMFFSGVE